MNNNLLLKSKEYILSQKIYFNYIETFETFASSVLKHTRIILIDNNTTFAFERKGNSREGALTYKSLNNVIDNNKMYVKVIKIRKDTSFINQIHTYFHELAHLVNNHNNEYVNDKNLTRSQKEYVAETIAQSLLFSFCGGEVIENIDSNGKWDQSTYIEKWITNSRIGKKSSIEMWGQIYNGFNIISEVILKSLNIKIE